MPRAGNDLMPGEGPSDGDLLWCESVKVPDIRYLNQSSVGRQLLAIHAGPRLHNR